MDNTLVLSVGVSLPLWERPEFAIKLTLGAPLMIFLVVIS